MHTNLTDSRLYSRDTVLSPHNNDASDSQGEGLWCSVPGSMSFSIQLLSDLPQSKTQSVGIWSKSNSSLMIHAILFSESACSGDSVKVTWKGRGQHLSILPGEGTSPNHVVSATHEGIDPCTFGFFSRSLCGRSVYSLNTLNQNDVSGCSYHSLSHHDQWLITFREKFEKLAGTENSPNTILVEPVYQVHACMRLLPNLYSDNRSGVLCPHEIAALDFIANQAQRQEFSDSLLCNIS